MNLTLISFTFINLCINYTVIIKECLNTFYGYQGKDDGLVVISFMRVKICGNDDVILDLVLTE